MSYPTILGPWFVVQRMNYGRGDNEDDGVAMEYYAAAEDGEMWQRDQKRALLFMSLQSAARVAASEGAEVRVLYSKEEAEEFGRR